MSESDLCECSSNHPREDDLNEPREKKLDEHVIVECNLVPSKMADLLSKYSRT